MLVQGSAELGRSGLIQRMFRVFVHDMVVMDAVAAMTKGAAGSWRLFRCLQALLLTIRLFKRCDAVLAICGSVISPEPYRYHRSLLQHVRPRAMEPQRDLDICLLVSLQLSSAHPSRGFQMI